MSKEPCDPTEPDLWPIFPFVRPLRLPVVIVPPGLPPGPNHQKIMDYVQVPAHPSITSKQACLVIGKPNTSDGQKAAYKILMNLTGKGYLEQVARGLFRIAPKYRISGPARSSAPTEPTPPDQSSFTLDSA